MLLIDLWKIKTNTPKPKKVCLCGSTRFSQAFQDANLSETLAGNIVLSIGCNTKSDQGLGLTEEDKIRLDVLHLFKIDDADEILVLNVGGYIGESTRREIQYAQATKKPIRYVEPQENAPDTASTVTPEPDEQEVHPLDRASYEAFKRQMKG